MRNWLLVFLFAVNLISCSSNDDKIDCSVIDIAPQLFFIEYINKNGNNLLDNGTYIQEEIEVTLGGITMGEVYTHTGGSFLVIYEYGQLQNNENDYIINLSSTESDIMQLEYSQKSGICGTLIYTVEKAIYNGEEMELETYLGNEKITVIRSN